MGAMDDEAFMRLALREAEAAGAEDEVPVGCVIVDRKAGKVIAKAHNQRETLKDPTAHAEMIAITAAAESMESWRLEECDLYVTLEPCPMCAGAAALARIRRVVYGASDPKAADLRLNHRVELVGGVMAAECGGILSGYFRGKRAVK